MKRHTQVAALALTVVAALVAQAPKGWKMRVDHSTSSQDPDGTGNISFVTSGSGFHATNPAAAIYWNPADKASGTYTIKGTFTLMKPSGHTNYYGIVFGGSDLDGPQAKYLYFMVAQNGTWLIKRHTPDGQAENVSSRTPSDAVKKPDDTGKSTNTLEVRVGADKIDYVVNGTVVNSTPKSGATANPDGIYGIRVNHLLEVQIDGFAMTK
ncbi:MAG TPA: hypothetical protein VKU19_26600 [Bryobacteraceae bacterium]|nr:hypothetical protein [Bryobacteraceae bacterium]